MRVLPGLLLLASLSAQAQSCIDLFSAGAKVYDLQEYSRRRFDPSVDQLRGSSPEIAYWKAQVGKPVSAIKSFFRIDKTTHLKIVLSPSRTVALALGSDNKLRLYSVKDGQLLNTIKLDSNKPRETGEIIDVVTLSDSHFVIGFESAWHRTKNEQLGFKMFRPQHLELYNFEGQMLAQYGSEVVIKGNVYLPQKNVWITADQDSVEIIPMPQVNRGTTAILSGFLANSFMNHHYVSAIAASKDGHTLFVGMSKSRHNAVTSDLIAIDITDTARPVLVGAKTIELSQIYKIEKLDNGQLRVTGSIKDARSDEPTVTIDVP